MSIFSKALRKLTGARIIKKKKVRESMEVIRLYAVLIFFFIVFFIFWFTVDAVINHKPDLEEFREFFNSVIASSAVIGFLSRYLIDTDNDGRPDAAIKEKDDVEDEVRNRCE